LGLAEGRNSRRKPHSPFSASSSRRLRPVEVHDVEFLRANTERKIKITLLGPFTMSRQAKNEYYKEELVMDYAVAVNAEIRDLKAAGADVIQLDEPWLQALAEVPRSSAASWREARSRG
jgi:5-methyltetrahydropteroyltriglutamate--homocysteine methyltransferase